jgi:hypothetical protein
MFWKSLITGTVLALMAASVVYFGTGGEIAQADIQRAVKTTKTATKTVTTSVKDTIDDLTNRNSDKDVVKEAALKTDTATDSLGFENAVITNMEAPDDEALNKTDDSQQRRWLSHYLNALKTEKEQGPVKKTEAMVWQEKIKKNNVVPSLSTPAETEFEDVYKTILKQTEVLDIIELRDRAYLSLIDYIVRNDGYDKAPAVINKISQPELRDTARSNVAVGYARKGDRRKAFSILDEVETAALEDVLRLQVIEAMTTPEETKSSAQ